MIRPLMLQVMSALVFHMTSYQLLSLKKMDMEMSMGLHALTGMLINHGAKVLTMNGVNLHIIGAM